MVGKAKAQRRRDRSKRDAATLIVPPVTSLPMSGDVIGTTDASIVDSIANVTVMPSILPATDGRNLTNVPAPTNLQSGTATLDSSGAAFVPYVGTPAVALAGAINGLNPAGILNCNISGPSILIQSSAGATDFGVTVGWIAF